MRQNSQRKNRWLFHVKEWRRSGKKKHCRHTGVWQLRGGGPGRQLHRILPKPDEAPGSCVAMTAGTRDEAEPAEERREMSDMITDKRTGEPYLNIWFGNFYRPAYDDREFVRESIALLKRLGFQSILLDTKAWEDVRERCEGGEASPYVAMQEYMQQIAKEYGMSHEFLALYLNGDNLYPAIRFSPPIYGESVTDQDGKDGKWYRYWSDRARDSMESHVQRIMERYGGNYARILCGERERKPICSMWDPIVAPSFDAEGRERYISWLSDAYQGEIDRINRAYGIAAPDFASLKKEDYWFSCRYPDRLTFSEEEAKAGAPAARMMLDNRKWQRDELVLYFQDMQKRLHRVDEELWLCPDMAQWGYFLNVDGAMLSGVGFADLWDTATRGIDIYRLAEYVDCANFLSVPVTPDGDPDAWVTACHHSMLRCINRGREFIGGIYWGRFLYNDIYSVITPCEIVASIVAGGASGYTSYGMCGLDDGGVLHRMGQQFLDSLARANEWAKQVIPYLGTKRPAEIAILFPSAMALCETMRTEGNKERRLDLLGWYRACRELGAEADVTDAEGFLADDARGRYRVLILPDDDCYAMDPQPELEKYLLEWCRDGGIVLCGPYNAIVRHTFGLTACEHRPDAIFYGEAGMVKSREFCTWPGGETVASYLSDRRPCVTKYRCGKGLQYAFGFSYGYAGITKTVPHVPAEQGNHELYPLELMRENILRDILRTAGIRTDLQKGIERAYFANGEIRINHTSYPVQADGEGEKLYQYPVNGSLLLPHSAVVIWHDPDKNA